MPYIGDGEMRNMKNLSSDAYPYLTTRKGRVPYTFTTTIPSPAGEAYIETDKLPPPSEENANRVYKLTAAANNAEYISGQFYQFKNEKWEEYKGDDYWLGATKIVTSYSSKNIPTLVDKKFEILEYSEDRYPEGYNNGNSILYDKKYCTGNENEFVFSRYKVKYLGETTEQFEKGKSYAYCTYVKANWIKGTWINGNKGGDVTEMPVPNSNLAKNRYYYRYTGETNENFTKDTYYKCVVSGRVYWEECEPFYFAAEEMPESGDIVRYCSSPSGAPVVNTTYVADYESNADGLFLYYRQDDSSAGIEVGYLPVITEEAVYKYIGPSSEGDFAKCVEKNEAYDYEIVEQPNVKREVTLKEYLDNYEGSGLKDIVEIGAFNGNLAALIVDGSGLYKLYYDGNLWPVKNISNEGGKRLVNVGNRLIVGESGSYLHVKTTKEGETVKKELEFFSAGDSFSNSIDAQNFEYGNGREKEKQWEAWGEFEGSSYFKLYARHGEDYQLKALAENLKEGIDFSVYAKKEGIENKQYLKVTSVSFEEKKLISTWSVGNNLYYDYADVLIINATGAWKNFDWYKATKDVLVFESTSPHYYDVVAWKKRLWGYSSNVLHGTIADIFDDKGFVDWNTGGNTQTESISQPLWQGGDITGLAALMNGLAYFKEDNITVVTGNYPAILSGDTIPCIGLPSDNRKSVAVGNESVYYLGRGGVMRFGGELPRCISTEAKIQGTEAVGATDGAKYWLSIKENNGEYALYVYDIMYGLWHKEDNIKVSSFAVFNGCMHMASGTEIYSLNGANEDIDWEFELWYDEGTHRKKKYKQIDIRGDVGDNCELWLKADDGEWRLIGSPNKGSIKLIPFDCVELNLKLKGKGRCEIKSIDRMYEIVE
jgi:hypothetical protein